MKKSPFDHPTWNPYQDFSFFLPQLPTPHHPCRQQWPLPTPALSSSHLPIDWNEQCPCTPPLHAQPMTIPLFQSPLVAINNTIEWMKQQWPSTIKSIQTSPSVLPCTTPPVLLCMPPLWQWGFLEVETQGIWCCKKPLQLTQPSMTSSHHRTFQWSMTKWQHLAIINANPSPNNPGTLNDAIHRWQC